MKTCRGILIGMVIVLTLGFWSGCVGSFRETVYFSMLTGATMLIALICDILFLPALRGQEIEMLFCFEPGLEILRGLYEIESPFSVQLVGKHKNGQLQTTVATLGL